LNHEYKSIREGSLKAKIFQITDDELNAGKPTDRANSFVPNPSASVSGKLTLQNLKAIIFPHCNPMLRFSRRSHRLKRSFWCINRQRRGGFLKRNLSTP